MFKTRYTVTTVGSRTIVRRVGKSRAKVLARRIPLSPAGSSEIPAETTPQRPRRKHRVGRTKR